MEARMKTRSRVLFFMVLVFIMALSVFTLAADKGFYIDEQILEKDAVRRVVQDYFDVRYQARKNLSIPDFTSIVSSTSEDTFENSEREKLDIELYNAKINNLYFQEYKIILDFINVDVNLSTRTATVIVSEGSDIVFEISSPTVSSLRGVKHIIELRKEENKWKIVDDQYDDNLWRILKKNKVHKAEILQLQKPGQGAQ
jgi:hypothetical protein